MSIEEFKNTLSTDEVNALRAVCAKTSDVSEDDARTLYDFIMERAAPALGDDQVAEPFRYLATAFSGLRAMDLEALIGEGFDAATFADFNTALGFAIFGESIGEPKVYSLNADMRKALLHMVGHTTLESCAADIGLYLMEHLDAGHPLRDSQAYFMLIIGRQLGEALRLFGTAEGSALRSIVETVGHTFGHDGRDEFQDAIVQSLAIADADIDYNKVYTLLTNDVVGVIGNADGVLAYMKRIEDNIISLLPTHPELAVVLGLARLRYAQAYRIQKNEKMAQQHFIGALSYMMPMLEKADPQTVLPAQLDQYWLALKICQEMAQPKGMNAVFATLATAESRLAAALDGTDRRQMDERIIMQHIDMAKTRLAMPETMRKDLADHTGKAVELLKAYLNNEAYNDIDPDQRAAYYQALGELCHTLGRDDESYDALTEAQILQLRRLGEIRRDETGGTMTAEGLNARLSLSVTNHMLAAHMRNAGNRRHDLGVLLDSNMTLARDCFAAHGRDIRALHFLINAALEQGDFQRSDGRVYDEYTTYSEVTSRIMPMLNNARIDQQTAVDVAMLHTKLGQATADDSVARTADAMMHYDIAYKLWDALANNTRNAEYRRNADAVRQLMQQASRPASDDDDSDGDD